MKLRNFFYLLLALPFVFASCSNNEEPAQKVTLTITSETSYEYDVDGGNTIVFYTLENAPEEAVPTVSCDAEWLTVKAGSNIAIKVARNYDEARSATIVVSYKSQSQTITVNQAGREIVRFDAMLLEGTYYAYEYSDTPNYYVCLTDLGSDAEGYAVANGTYYLFDIYSEEAVIDAQGYATIPAGTYTLAYNTDKWSIGNNEYTYYFTVDAQGSLENEALYDEATLVVTENSITATVFMDSVMHVVTYNGAPKLSAL